jgi:hypothetical protein
LQDVLHGFGAGKALLDEVGFEDETMFKTGQRHPFDVFGDDGIAALDGGVHPA